MSPRAARPSAAAAPGPIEPEVVRWFERLTPGRTRRAVDRMFADLGENAPLSAELARDLADLVDSARERQDPKLWLAAAGRLEQVLGRIPRGADSGPAGPDPISDALGSGPE